MGTITSWGHVFRQLTLGERRDRERRGQTPLYASENQCAALKCTAARAWHVSYWCAIGPKGRIGSRHQELCEAHAIRRAEIVGVTLLRRMPAGRPRGAAEVA